MIEPSCVKDVKEKGERTKKNVVLARVKEWCLKCKWLDQKCINNLKLLAKIVKDKESKQTKKMFANNVKETK